MCKYRVALWFFTKRGRWGKTCLLCRTLARKQRIALDAKFRAPQMQERVHALTLAAKSGNPWVTIVEMWIDGKPVPSEIVAAFNEAEAI